MCRVHGGKPDATTSPVCVQSRSNGRRSHLLSTACRAAIYLDHLVKFMRVGAGCFSVGAVKAVTVRLASGSWEKA